MPDTIRLDASDNVVTAIRPLEVGTEGATQLIPRGHKMASEDIPSGAPVKKYAQLIGYAAEDIAKGQHVHTHNLEFRNVEQTYEFSTNLRPAPEPATRDTFMGYRRENGKVGTRNFIAVLTSVNCSATAARKIAEHFTDERLAAYPNVDGVTPVMAAAGFGSVECDIRGYGIGIPHYLTPDVQQASIAALEVLIEAGADVNDRNTGGRRGRGPGQTALFGNHQRAQMHEDGAKVVEDADTALRVVGHRGERHGQSAERPYLRTTVGCNEARPV